jgi:hypothetical protein
VQVSIAAAGDIGPPILIKKMKEGELDGDEIKVMKFRTLRFVAGSMPGALWLVPFGVKGEEVFRKYYLEVLPAFIRHIDNSLEPL